MSLRTNRQADSFLRQNGVYLSDIKRLFRGKVGCPHGAILLRSSSLLSPLDKPELNSNNVPKRNNSRFPKMAPLSSVGFCRP